MNKSLEHEKEMHNIELITVDTLEKRGATESLALQKVQS